MFPDLTRDDVFRLETRRLWLRWPRQADATAIASLAGERVVAEMTALIPHPYPPHEADCYVLQARRANAEGRGLQLAVAPKGKSVIGMIGIGLAPEGFSDAGRPHLGFWIGRPQWGQGFAQEAARALIGSYFAYAGGDELTASARLDNPASRRVLEACGFVRQGEATMRFPALDAVFPVERLRLDRRRWLTLDTTFTGGLPQTRGANGIALGAAV
jgi:RimJ/RimL family protein N-acetyltransferase